MTPYTHSIEDGFTYVPLADCRVSAHMLRLQSQHFSETGLFSELLNAIPIVMMVLNRQRQVIYSNRALFNLLGLSQDEVIGMRPGELWECAHALSSPGGCGTTESCHVCGAACAIVASIHGQPSVEECRIIRQDGGALELSITTKPLTVQGEKFVVLTVQDISAEKRRNALESIFFHDVLNLAGILEGYAELLDTDTQPQDVSRIQAVLKQTSWRLTEEIVMQRDLLTAERGDLVVRTEPVHSRTVLQHVLERYGHYNSNCRCHLQIAPGAVEVIFVSDPILLERVLGNMVKNALEASGFGQTITMDVTATDDEITFSVHNEGAMPQPVQLQVFQRSFSTKGDGRGLGTYGMKLLTEQYLNGTIRFTSSEADGTTFFATYPRLQPEELPEGR